MSAAKRDRAVDVVIPSYEGRHHLERCLPSLARQTHSAVHVIVVDNGSRDGTAAWIAEHHPDVECVRLPENRGFSAAVNAGVRAGSSPFIALLNNDTVADAGWVAALVRALEDDPDAGTATSRITSLDDASLMDNAGDGFGRKGISYPIGYREPDLGQYRIRRRVFGACGAACLYRREVFARVGWFDEDFFAYHEDADLSFRAQLAGVACVYVPDAIVGHAGSATSGGRINPFTVYLSTRNNLHVLIKNLPGGLFVQYFPWLLWGQAYWFLKMAVKEGMWAPWFTGILAGLRGSRRMVRKRRAILGSVRIDARELNELVRASEAEIRRSIRTKRGRFDPTSVGEVRT